jgi:hypothetical protein
LADTLEKLDEKRELDPAGRLRLIEVYEALLEVDGPQAKLKDGKVRPRAANVARLLRRWNQAARHYMELARDEAEEPATHLSALQDAMATLAQQEQVLTGTPKAEAAKKAEDADMPLSLLLASLIEVATSLGADGELKQVGVRAGGGEKAAAVSCLAVQLDSSRDLAPLLTRAQAHRMAVDHAMTLLSAASDEELTERKGKVTMKRGSRSSTSTPYARYVRPLYAAGGEAAAAAAVAAGDCLEHEVWPWDTLALLNDDDDFLSPDDAVGSSPPFELVCHRRFH